MRYLLPFIFLILFMGCHDQRAFDKPDNVIEVETMEQILYDIALMQSMKSNNYTAQEMQKYFTEDYIYIKYNIDSLQLAENEIYYSKFPKIYLDIHKKILSRLTRLKDSMENITKEAAAAVKLGELPKLDK